MSPSPDRATHEFTVKGRRFALSAEDVRRSLQGAEPESIRNNGHYVVVDELRFPVKQVVALVTGLDRLDFQTNQARDILRGCGFEVRRNAVAGG